MRAVEDARGVAGRENEGNAALGEPIGDGDRTNPIEIDVEKGEVDLVVLGSCEPVL